MPAQPRRYAASRLRPFRAQLSEDEEPDDESEQQLLEITEYVRLGALAVFTEFNEPEKPAGDSPTLH